jgi:hypothetical protein
MAGAQPFHKIVGRHDHVIALIAAAQLGKQFVIVGKQADLHPRAAGLGEIGQRGFPGIGIPGVEVERGAPPPLWQPPAFR